uniref:G-protein coupled receptors family 1 profile domain-containing protein n=1 Tax=Ditylenchus dipsaci TaxID=166011 RepID=A0A915EW60_9BILA
MGYNCSFYDYNTIPYESRRHPIIAAILFVCYFVFELLYIPSLIVLSKRKNRRQPCYLLMLCLVLIDMFALILTALYCGFMLLKGEVFCSSPLLVYGFGVYANMIWCSEMLVCIALAVNRCLTIIWGKTASRFFGITQTRWLIFIIVIITTLCGILTPPILFNSTKASFFFNPHETYFPDLRKKTFIQVLIVNCISVLGPLSIALMQVIEYPTFILLTSTIFLTVITKGSSSMVYLTLNRQIKNEVFQLISNEFTPSSVSRSPKF